MAPAPKCLCGECRRCKHRAYMRAWYQRKTEEERRAWVARRDPEKVRAADRARFQRDHAKRMAANRAYLHAHPEVAAAISRRHRERYPDRYRARTAVNNAVRDGRLTREPCEACGAEPAHAHHADYARPLDVRWLCRAHHAEVHASPF